MKNQLSLDAFKKMADGVQEKEVMERVTGGTEESSYCHGWLGQANKWLDDVFNE